MTVTKLYTNEIISSRATMEGHLEYSTDKVIYEANRDSHLLQLLKIGKISFWRENVTLGLLCNNAQMGQDGKVLGFPTDGALLSAALQTNIDDLRKSTKRYHSFFLTLKIFFSEWKKFLLTLKRNLWEFAVKQQKDFYIM